MKAPDKSITDNLQIACDITAHLSAQMLVDAAQVKAFGVKWLARHIKKWHEANEEYLKTFIGRLLYFDTDPEYDAGSVNGADEIEGILENEESLVAAAIDKFCEFRKAAWDVRADYTPDVYEHAIEYLEFQCFKIERELQLWKDLGKPGYIGARIPDD